MGTYSKVVSVVKPIDAIRTFIGGTAKDITSAWVFINGVRKQVFQTTEKYTEIFSKTSSCSYSTSLGFGKYKIVISGAGGGGAVAVPRQLHPSEPDGLGGGAGLQHRLPADDGHPHGLSGGTRLQRPKGQGQPGVQLPGLPGHAADHRAHLPLRRVRTKKNRVSPLGETLFFVGVNALGAKRRPFTAP